MERWSLRDQAYPDADASRSGEGLDGAAFSRRLDRRAWTAHVLLAGYAGRIELCLLRTSGRANAAHESDAGAVARFCRNAEPARAVLADGVFVRQGCGSQWGCSAGRFVGQFA